jgi:hypothetical protein
MGMGGFYSDGYGDGLVCWVNLTKLHVEARIL